MKKFDHYRTFDSSSRQGSRWGCVDCGRLSSGKLVQLGPPVFQRRCGRDSCLYRINCLQWSARRSGRLRQRKSGPNDVQPAIRWLAHRDRSIVCGRRLDLVNFCVGGGRSAGRQRWLHRLRGCADVVKEVSAWISVLAGEWRRPRTGFWRDSFPLRTRLRPEA